MSTTTRLLGFGAVLVAVFFAAFALGAFVDADSGTPPADHVRHSVTRSTS